MNAFFIIPQSQTLLVNMMNRKILYLYLGYKQEVSELHIQAVKSTL